MVKLLILIVSALFEAHCSEINEKLVNSAILENDVNVQKWLDAGADIDSIKENCGGRTALHWAAYRSNPKTLKVLLARGADVNKQDKNGRTPLHLAMIAHRLQYVDQLFENNALVNIQDVDGRTPLHDFIEKNPSSNYQILARLLEGGADVTLETNRGRTALMMAAQNGAVEDAQLLLKYVPQEKMLGFVNAQDENGTTALMYAVTSGSTSTIDMIKLLLKNGADESITNHQGITACQMASYDDEDEEYRDLLCHKVYCLDQHS